MTAPSSTPFPFFRLEGSSYDVGRAHGELLGDRIQIGLDFYKPRIERRVGLPWRDTLVRSAAIADGIRATSPELVDEMAGIADGAEQQFEAIVALNARTILLRTTEKEADPVAKDEDGECTTGAVLPGSTADGHTLIFGNWDQNVQCLETSALLEIRVHGRPAVFVITEAGVLIRTGFNEFGIGITGNSLVSNLDTGDVRGVPWPVVRRRVLWHDRIAPAVQEVFKSERAHSGNHVIADAEGFAVDLEATPREVFALVPEFDMISHSNHFLSPAAQAKVVDVQVGTSPSSLYRDHRLRQVLSSRLGSVTVDDIQEALRDHFGHPQSVCAHPGPTGTVTVASHITDLTDRTMRVTSGPPCQNEYRTFSLESRGGSDRSVDTSR